MTFPERLDAAQTGQEFAISLEALFRALEQAIDEEGEDE